MPVEFVQHQTHTVHQAVHVCWLALVVGGATVRSKRSLEGFKILHPLNRKVVWLYIGLVKDENEGKFCFV